MFVINVCMSSIQSDDYVLRSQETRLTFVATSETKCEDNKRISTTLRAGETPWVTYEFLTKV